MRLLERLIALGVVLALVYSASGIAPLLLPVLLLLLLSLVCAHTLFEGMHWQMIPIYISILLLIPLWRPDAVHASHVSKLQFALIVGSGALLLVGLVACFALPMFKLMTPTGSYPVGTRMVYLIDATREEIHPGAPPGKREVVVQLWYPAASNSGPRARYRLRSETKFRSSYQAVLPTQSIQDASLAPGEFPILIFNHAWGGFRNRSTFLAQELASNGFIVAAISHTYNASVTTLNDGRVALPVDQVDIGFYAEVFVPVEERLRIADEELRIQVDDCIFVLDELLVRNRTPGDPLHQHLRTDRVGTYGHSYGGAVSLEFALDDSRVQAALQLDGVLHGKTLASGLKKPILIMDSEWLSSPHGDEADSDPLKRSTAQLWALFQRAKKQCLAAYGGWELIIQGTNHENFADVAFMSPLRKLSNAGPLPQRKAAAIISAYAVAFFRHTLLGEEMGLLAPEAKGFPEATMKLWRPQAGPLIQD